MKPKLYLITKEFPFGKTEDSFVRLEYPYLCEHFDVTVFATDLKKQIYNVDEETDAYIINATQTNGEKMKSFLHFLFSRACYRETRILLKEKEKFAKRMYRMLMFGTAGESFYRKLKASCKLEKNTKAFFYFYC